MNYVLTNKENGLVLNFVCDDHILKMWSSDMVCIINRVTREETRFLYEVWAFNCV